MKYFQNLFMQNNSWNKILWEPGLTSHKYRAQQYWKLKFQEVYSFHQFTRSSIESKWITLWPPYSHYNFWSWSGLICSTSSYMKIRANILTFPQTQKGWCEIYISHETKIFILSLHAAGDKPWGKRTEVNCGSTSIQ